MVPLYVVSALVSVTIFAGLAIVIKYLIPKAGGPIQFLTVQLVAGLILITPVFVIHIHLGHAGIEMLSPKRIIQIFFAGLFGFLGFVTYIIGLDRGNASVGGVVLSSRVFFSVPLAILFVGEYYQSLIYVCILIAFLGAVLVSWQSELSLYQLLTFQAKGIRWFLATALLWALANLIVRQLNNEIPVITFLFVRQIYFAIFALGLYVIYRQNGTAPISFSYLFLGLTVIYISLNLLGQATFIFAIGSSLSITEAIGTFEGTLTFIFSIIFARLVSNRILKEPLDIHSLSIRIGGVVFSILGTLGVVFLS